jgi:hypothetical protein
MNFETPQENPESKDNDNELENYKHSPVYQFNRGFEMARHDNLSAIAVDRNELGKLEKRSDLTPDEARGYQLFDTMKIVGSPEWKQAIEDLKKSYTIAEYKDMNVEKYMSILFYLDDPELYETKIETILMYDQPGDIKIFLDQEMMKMEEFKQEFLEVFDRSINHSLDFKSTDPNINEPIKKFLFNSLEKKREALENLDYFLHLLDQAKRSIE